MRNARLVFSAVYCLNSGTLSGCGDPSGPESPSLDIRGSYDVEWFVGYNRPDAANVGEDHTLPTGYCPAVVVIATQSRSSFRGTITTSEDRLPICHAASFDIHGTLIQQHLPGESDYWDLEIASDIEPLLGCQYAGKSRGNEGYGFHGAGTAEPTGGLSLAFSNIYRCASGRWWIVAGASGTRRGP
jgi:hypothetical protein